MPDETVLITGANGFIGSKVVEILLDYGFTKLRCLVRSNRNLSNLHQLAATSKGQIEFLQGNLLSREYCLRAVKEVSVIYHLAAGTEKSFPGCFLNSVVTTRNLLDATINEHTLKRFVNISSIAVYSNENIPRGGLLDESSAVDTKWIERHEPYTYGKAKQDEIVIQYGREHNLPYVIVRPGVVFGPGKAKITDRIGTSTFGVFLHLGLGNRIPLTYNDNCAEAIVLAGLRKGIERQVINILDDDLPKSREFLRLYKRNVRRFFSIPVPYFIWYFFCYLWEKYSKWSEAQLPPVFNRSSCAVYWKGNRYSNRKAKELLGWNPSVTMSQSLQIFFAYMREVEGKKK
ncbi:MAG: NAD(P)-dependent oxidoreductase [Syntrophales bacterium]|jgi:nucleoside-diphosphate-sugar epimerase